MLINIYPVSTKSLLLSLGNVLSEWKATSMPAVLRPSRPNRPNGRVDDVRARGGR